MMMIIIIILIVLQGGLKKRPLTQKKWSRLTTNHPAKRGYLEVQLWISRSTSSASWIFRTLHPRKLTLWHLKIGAPWKRRFILETIRFWRLYMLVFRGVMVEVVKG